MKLKRGIALVLIFILVGLYIATFITSIFTSPAAPELFKASVLATFVIPVYMYLYLLFYKYSQKRAEENKKELDNAIKEGAAQSEDTDSNNMDYENIIPKVTDSENINAEKTNSKDKQNA